MAKKSSKWLLAGLAGLAAGLAIGVLFAPARGSKTRKRLKKNLRDLSESESGEEFTEKLKSFTDIFSSPEKEEPDSPDKKP